MSLIFSREIKHYAVITFVSNMTQVLDLAHGLGLWCYNATFNNISVISWWSVLLVEETGVPGENHQPVASH
jgi:hypothetical protein